MRNFLHDDGHGTSDDVHVRCCLGGGGESCVLRLELGLGGSNLGSIGHLLGVCCELLESGIPDGRGAVCLGGSSAGRGLLVRSHHEASHSSGVLGLATLSAELSLYLVDSVALLHLEESLRSVVAVLVGAIALLRVVLCSPACGDGREFPALAANDEERQHSQAC